MLPAATHTHRTGTETHSSARRGKGDPPRTSLPGAPPKSPRKRTLGDTAPCHAWCALAFTRCLLAPCTPQGRSGSRPCGRRSPLPKGVWRGPQILLFKLGEPPSLPQEPIHHRLKSPGKKPRDTHPNPNPNPGPHPSFLLTWPPRLQLAGNPARFSAPPLAPQPPQPQPPRPAGWAAPRGSGRGRGPA